MVDWWGNSSGKPVMPLGGDWWNTAGGSGSRPLLPSATMTQAPPGQAARYLDFTASGAGIANAGISEKNMFPRYEKLRGVRDQKEGGSRQLWGNLSRWTTTPNAKNLDPVQAKLFNLYHTTGKRDPGLKNSTVAAALDWGIRDNTRGQVHKERFMDSALGKILGVVATAAGAVVGGPIGAGVASGLYNGVGNKSVVSGLTGAATGYAGGSLLGRVGLPSNLAGIPGGGTASGLAAAAGNAPLTSINGLFTGRVGAQIASRAGGTAASRLVSKGAAATAKALRLREEREAAKQAFLRQQGAKP